MTGVAIADVSFSGSAHVNYLADGDDSVLSSDAALTATMTNGGAYSAAVGIGVGEVANAPTQTVTVTTPMATIIVDQTGDMNEASTTYASIGSMAGVGTTENAAIETSIAVSLGDISASFTSDLNLDSDNSSFGASGSMAGMSFTFGSKNEDMGISLSGNALGGSVSVAFEEVGTDSNSGVSIAVPMSGSTVTLTADDTAGDDSWSASVATDVNGATVSVGTDDEGDTTVDVSAPIAGGATLVADYTTDGDVGSEYGVSYDLGGGATFLLSHSDRAAADDYDLGTNLKLSFTF